MLSFMKVPPTTSSRQYRAQVERSTWKVACACQRLITRTRRSSYMRSTKRRGETRIRFRGSCMNVKTAIDSRRRRGASAYGVYEGGSSGYLFSRFFHLTPAPQYPTSSRMGTGMSQMKTSRKESG